MRLFRSPSVRLADLASEFRETVKEKFSSIELRRRFWNGVITGKVSQLLQSGKEDEARAELTHLLETKPSDHDVKGEVYLVGAGPGDPDLLTIRALRLIQRAEVVLHDRLVSESVLALCPSSAELVYVGKERASHTMRQQTSTKPWSTLHGKASVFCDSRVEIRLSLAEVAKRLKPWLNTGLIFK